MPSQVLMLLESIMHDTYRMFLLQMVWGVIASPFTKNAFNIHHMPSKDEVAKLHTWLPGWFLYTSMVLNQPLTVFKQNGIYTFQLYAVKILSIPKGIQHPSSSTLVKLEC